MSADPGQGRRGVRDASSIGDVPESHNQACPWACIRSATVLYDKSGREAATLCVICDTAISRTQWLVELDRAAERPA